MTLLDLYAYVRDGGIIAVLLLVIIGGMRGWYFWKWYVDEQRARIAKLEAQLDRAVGAAESGTGLANRAIRQAEGRQGERAE